MSVVFLCRFPRYWCICYFLPPQIYLCMGVENIICVAFLYKFCQISTLLLHLVNSNLHILVPSDNSSQATIRPKRQFVPSDNSSQATIRPKRQFVPNSKMRQFVPNVNSSYFEKVTIRPICKKRQFVPNGLIDKLITNLLKVEMKEIIKLQLQMNSFKHVTAIIKCCILPY